ncbi:ATP-binding protein [Acidovorax sacchari]|uniref:ATP-binding protein n=1 Tax=Acidovorax sacchari TaxID=3230736 RepID=UPI0039E633B8
MSDATPGVPSGRGWPRSLFGRHLLLIVALVVAGQLCAAWIARRLIVEPRIATAAEGAARQLAALRAGLQALPPAQRQAFLDAFNRQVAGVQGRVQGPGAPPAQGGPAMTPLERRFQQALSDRLGATGWLAPGTAPVWSREGRGVFWLRLQPLPDAGDDPAAAWVALPVTGTFRAFTGAWLAATLAGGLLALAGAAWLQRQLHRPLRRVVAAAQAIARGQDHMPLPEDGPQEIAALAHSINHMADALQATDRERALMLAGISHDLRTPLTKLRLAAEIARPRMEPALVASMERSVDEMDAVVVQFMDFARLDAGTEVREAAHAAPLDALAEALAQAQADHGRTLVLECGAPTPVAVQPQALRRAVENLVENAWRHGLPPVVLRTGEDADGAIAWIEVADSGAGIDPADLERLRRPFARGSGTARAGTPGAGLGLAIADRVARLHGGRLDLRGGPGQGLRARIMVPLRPVHSDTSGPGRE